MAVGGVLYVDLLGLPPPARHIAHWTLRQVPWLSVAQHGMLHWADPGQGVVLLYSWVCELHAHVLPTEDSNGTHIADA
jgi:hypothetical protein